MTHGCVCVRVRVRVCVCVCERDSMAGLRGETQISGTCRVNTSVCVLT